MRTLAPIFSLILLVACGGDDDAASCADVCQAARDCGMSIPGCESSCETMTTQRERECVVTASSCIAANACFGGGGVDGGGVDGGGGGTDAGGGGTDSGGSCRCSGAINGDAYDVACGELFCADGLERRCSTSASVSETGETCGGGSCLDQGASGCGDGNNCCDIPGSTPVCMNNSCCQLNGAATSSSTCCFVFLDDGMNACCTTSGADSCD